MIYAMADKFLNAADLNDIKEGMSMTRLGQMIFDDGCIKGRNEGIQALFETLKELGLTKDAALNKVAEKFNLTPENANEYLEKYWK